MRAGLTSIEFAVILVSFAGCSMPQSPSPEQLNRGCVFMLPGIEGGSWQLDGSVRGLRDAGSDQGIEVISWGAGPFGTYSNLIDLSANQRRAKEFAGRIATYQQNHPKAPATLVGYSGGGGLALLTTEALPPGIKLDRLILIAAAVSSDYDTSKALAHCRRGIVNFYSNGDTLILGWGTRTFGTIDRKNADSAGRTGFIGAEGKLVHSDGLVQIAWTSDWLKHGHGGGHIGWLSRAWAKEILSPQIMTKADAAVTASDPKS